MQYSKHSCHLSCICCFGLNVAAHNFTIFTFWPLHPMVIANKSCERIVIESMKSLLQKHHLQKTILQHIQRLQTIRIYIFLCHSCFLWMNNTAVVCSAKFLLVKRADNFVYISILHASRSWNARSYYIMRQKLSALIAASLANHLPNATAFNRSLKYSTVFLYRFCCRQRL